VWLNLHLNAIRSFQKAGVAPAAAIVAEVEEAFAEVFSQAIAKTCRRRQEGKARATMCPACLTRKMPDPPSLIGVSLSRLDNYTEICSSCGVEEAFAGFRRPAG
jgi:hypothetical protein